MPSTQDFSFGSFVVAAGFLRDRPCFALGDGTLRLVGAGMETESARAHDGAILAAVFPGDGSVITGGDDGTLRRTRAGDTQILIEEGRKWLDVVAAGPAGAIACASGRIVLVRLADGRVRRLEHPRAVSALAFFPKGLRLAAAHTDGVTLHYVGSQAPPQVLSWKGAHLAVTVSPDAQYVVTGMQEAALHGWRLSDMQDLRMSGYPAKPRSLDWSFRGRFLATSGAPAAILWPFHYKEGPMGKAPLQLGARDRAVVRVACHPREEMVAIGYDDGMVLAARFADAAEALLRRPGGGPVSALAWEGSGRRLLVGTEEGEASLVDLTA